MTEDLEGLHAALLAYLDDLGVDFRLYKTPRKGEDTPRR
jgi:hypothetical protein